MLQPKRTKYRKVQKGRMKGNAQRGHMNFQTECLELNLYTKMVCSLTSRQIEAARIAATRYMKREGQLMD